MNWREGYPVLVPQAETLGAVAVIRSLGRAGYPVHACSTQPDALGLHSRFARTSTVCPDYPTGEFLPWFRRFLELRGIRAVVPSESLLLALRGHFDEFGKVLTCGPREDVVLAGMSKHELFHRLLGSSQGDHLPPTLLWESRAPLPEIADLERLGAPLYVKVDGVHSAGGERGDVFVEGDARSARRRLSSLRPRFRKATVQGHVPGRGVGAFFLVHEGQVLAEFMHRRLHEVPHTGGASSLRESWFHRGIRDDAERKLAVMRWQGVAMMEYRFDEPSGRYWLMEMNGRFWGSLHLALHAGVDFPRMLLDAFLGCPPEPVRRWPVGVRCRHTLPAELQHVWTKLKDRRLAPHARLWPIAEFFLLGADPRVRSDLLFEGDRGLYLKELGADLRAAVARIRRWGGRPDAQEASQARAPGGGQEIGDVRALAPAHSRRSADPLLSRDRDGR